MKIGAMVERLRKRNGWTLRELGETIDYSASHLSQIENDQVKNPLTPGDLVTISDATKDRLILDEYCTACPIRTRIMIRKFPPLNKIVEGPIAATVKVTQKLAEAADALQPMLVKLLYPNFREDPDYREYRNKAIMKLIDLKRGAEILLDKYVKYGVLTHDELKLLEELQQRECETKGYHIPGEA